MAVLQTADTSSTTGSPSVAFGSNVTTGSVIYVIGVAELNSNVDLTPSQSAGTATLSAFTEVAALDTLNSGDYFNLNVFYATVTSGGSCTIQVAFSGAPTWRAFVAAEAEDFDVHNTQSYLRSTAANPTSGNANPSAGASAWWRLGWCIQWDGSAAPAADTGDGWTDNGASMAYAGTDIARLESRRDTVAANDAAQFIDTTTFSFHACQVVFDEVGAGGGPVIPVFFHHYRMMKH